MLPEKFCVLPLISKQVQVVTDVKVLLTWFTLELSLPVAQAGAAHHGALLLLTLPFLPDTVVVTSIMTPLC